GGSEMWSAVPTIQDGGQAPRDGLPLLLATIHSTRSATFAAFGLGRKLLMAHWQAKVDWRLPQYLLASNGWPSFERLSLSHTPRQAGGVPYVPSSTKSLMNRT